MTVFITGGTGFIGRALVEELGRQSGFETLVLTRREPGESKFGERQRYFKGDVREIEDLRRIALPEGVDYLVHIAGAAHQFGEQDENYFRAANAEGTENICRWAAEKGIGNLILISSVSVYGDHGGATIDEDFPCRAAGVYAESKLAAEKMAEVVCRQNNIRLAILRLATVIGEGDPGNLGRLIAAVDRGRFVWIGKGLNRKTLIDRHDVARAIVQIIRKGIGADFGVYNVAGASLTMKEIVSEIYLSLGRRPLPFAIPVTPVMIGLGAVRRLGGGKLADGLRKNIEKWISDDIFAGTKILRDYGFEPQTPISESIGRQVLYYKKGKKNE
ncbi:MAG: NAD-dependent epimerase/dehydratase family protein [Acidobacteria bacterium]|nr:NAD-dependent epimerase/dehydratase family protein [Acidobacteriota bacterium]